MTNKISTEKCKNNNPIRKSFVKGAVCFAVLCALGVGLSMGNLMAARDSSLGGGQVKDAVVELVKGNQSRLITVPAKQNTCITVICDKNKAKNMFLEDKNRDHELIVHNRINYDNNTIDYMDNTQINQNFLDAQLGVVGRLYDMLGNPKSPGEKIVNPADTKELREEFREKFYKIRNELEDLRRPIGQESIPDDTEKKFIEGVWRVTEVVREFTKALSDNVGLSEYISGDKFGDAFFPFKECLAYCDQVMSLLKVCKLYDSRPNIMYFCFKYDDIKAVMDAYKGLLYALNNVGCDITVQGMVDEYIRKLECRKLECRLSLVEMHRDLDNVISSAKLDVPDVRSRLAKYVADLLEKREVCACLWRATEKTDVVIDLVSIKDLFLEAVKKLAEVCGDDQVDADKIVNENSSVEEIVNVICKLKCPDDGYKEYMRKNDAYLSCSAVKNWIGQKCGTEVNFRCKLYKDSWEGSYTLFGTLVGPSSEFLAFFDNDTKLQNDLKRLLTLNCRSTWAKVLRYDIGAVLQRFLYKIQKQITYCVQAKDRDNYAFCAELSRCLLSLEQYVAVLHDGDFEYSDDVKKFRRDIGKMLKNSGINLEILYLDAKSVARKLIAEYEEYERRDTGISRPLA